MKLFENDAEANLLPYDGSLKYLSNVLNNADAAYYFEKLQHTIGWKNDEVIIFGKRHITKRQVAWYGDDGYLYTYSNTTKQALAWTEELAMLKQLAEKLSGATFNSCLLNLYHHGDEGMAWHSDDEKSLVANAPIASLSLGAERRFLFRHKTSKETISLVLETGSLLVMQDATQANWLHALPKSKKIKSPRINLTFRTMRG